MGLNITGYSKVKLIEGSTSKLIEWKCDWMEDKDIDEWVEIYINPNFPLQGEGLEEGVYSYEDCIEGGSRSYSGWSNFREELAKNVGYTPVTEDEVPDEWDDYIKTGFLLRPHQSRVFNVESGTLYELINFSDCEGTINTKTCKKIYKDLQSVDSSKLKEYDQTLLYTLIQAFKVGADEGFVTFS